VRARPEMLDLVLRGLLILLAIGGALDQKAAQLEIEHFWAGSLRRAVIEGDVEQGSVMAGQSVGMVTREQSTREIIEELVEQALTSLERQASGGG
ncbi:MAG TPA: hypothetical protein VNB28_09145, partial [Methylomirabilota bacterium]|nr:hypothetical protein [Methylomirabilota bacterium]